MSVIVWIGVAAAGALGALTRVGLDAVIVSRLLERRLPEPAAAAMATGIVNLTGAAALGLLDGVVVDRHLELVIGTALLGAYTTFSTWMLGVARLSVLGLYRLAAINVLLPLLAGFGAVELGHALGSAL